jgi:hypothetical protein
MTMMAQEWICGENDRANLSMIREFGWIYKIGIARNSIFLKRRTENNNDTLPLLG